MNVDADLASTSTNGDATAASYVLPDTPVVALGAQEHVRALLAHIGEDPQRDGLLGTPGRVVRALAELTSGYHVDIAELLAVRFDERHDELVMVRRVPFSSLCEHHMLPFTGFATVGYVPRTGIVGLSKIARLVDAYARRLQVQERLTAQIADAMTEHLDPLAVGVIVEAEHHCMAMRGIQRQAPMVTSCLRGVLRERADLRQEFLALAGY
jgi:GTP cyclohydrolase IA